MKIMLLAHNLRIAGGKAVGQNIISILPAIAPMHEYLVVVPMGCGYPTFPNKDNITVVECRQMGFGKRWLWEQWVLRKIVKSFNPDWVWALGNYCINYVKCPQSLLIHDPHLVYPESEYHFESFAYKLSKRLLKVLLKISLKKNPRLYVQTNVMKERVSQVYNYSIDRIGICPNAVSLNFCDTIADEEKRRILQFEGKFKIFMLSNYYGHKNFQGILAVYEKYGELLNDTVCIWTIDPNQNKTAIELLKRIRDSNLHDKIVNIGPIEHKNLPFFYKNIDALILPSFLESFSGTYIEAMHFQVPIITSDLDFAHAVCGEAALYVDPYNSKSLFEGIRLVVDSKNIRDRLIRKAKVQKTNFLRSWEMIVRDVLNQENIQHL